MKKAWIRYGMKSKKIAFINRRVKMNLEFERLKNIAGNNQYRVGK
jgi:hypothetical protein